MFVYLAVGAGVVILGALVARRRRGKGAPPALPADAPREGSNGDPANADVHEVPGHWLVSGSQRAKKGAQKKAPKKGRKKAQKKGETSDDVAKSARLGGPRGLRVGDVLLYADTELWLAGEVHFDEEGFALSLFITPGGVRASHVVMLDAEARDVAFLSETDEVPDGAVPTELPVGGLRLSLWRRGQAEVRTEGEQLPLVSERATYAILRGPAGRLLVVVDYAAGDRIALLGERVGEEFYEILPGSE